MADVFLRRRHDGILQILPTRLRRDVFDPYPESIAALLFASGLYVSTVIPGPLALAVIASCLARELWRARIARRLLCQPLAEVEDLWAARIRR